MNSPSDHGVCGGQGRTAREVAGSGIAFCVVVVLLSVLGVGLVVLPGLTLGFLAAICAAWLIVGED